MRPKGTKNCDDISPIAILVTHMVSSSTYKLTLVFLHLCFGQEEEKREKKESHFHSAACVAVWPFFFTIDPIQQSDNSYD